jgi:F420-dependent oxidoreductase-like protein
MRVGAHLVTFDFPGGVTAIGPTVAAFGQAAEEAGLDNVSVMDHYWQMIPIGGPELNMLEAYTTLGFLAAHTSTVELQVLVTGTTYRQPGLLAKIVTTLDVLSGGRALLGVGAAWYQDEHEGLGVPFPPTRERFERLEETLQVVRQMWSDDEGPYVGTHYKLGRTLNLPQPVRTPPIMIGGAGEKKTLRLVAKYADACNIFANPAAGPAAIEHKLAVLRGHCEAEGTDYDRIRKTILWASGRDPLADASGFVDQMKGFAAVGVEEVHVIPPTNDPAEYVRRLGRDVVPALHDL